jgi:signal transduction histidine kinase
VRFRAAAPVGEGREEGGVSVATLTAERLEALRQALRSMQSSADIKVAELAHRALGDLDDLANQLAKGDEHARLLALYEVSRALGSSLLLDDVLQQVMDAVIQLTGAERGLLLLFDQQSHERAVQVGRNFEGKDLSPQDIQVSRTVIKEVLRTGEGVVTTNALADERFRAQESVVAYALRSILCVPLRSRGQVMGVVYVDNRIKTALFDQHDREMLEAFAGQAAVAIDNARLYTQTDSALALRVQELETLQQIDRQLNTGLDAQRVLDLTLEWAQRGTRAESGWIALPTENEFVMLVAAGKDAGITLETSSPELSAALGGPPGVHHLPEDGGGEQLVVPLMHAGHPIAVIGLRRTRFAFESDCDSFLLRLAEHAAVAVENSHLYQAVQQANDAKSQFVSVVSHEMKTPMTSIRGYADLIRRGMVGPITDQQTEFLDIVLDNVDRMAALVSDLTDISRIETGRLRVNLAEVAIPPYLEEVVTSLRPQLDAKGQGLDVLVPDDLPKVQTDPTRLVQILTNLASNAVKYTPEGGQIFVTASRDNGFLRIAVQDTGIGMSQADQARLFTQFFRSDNPAVREQPGWGLGLSVTQSLVELLGGKIGVESDLGQGSTFWFTLPLSD